MTDIFRRCTERSADFFSRTSPFKGQKGQDKWVVFVVLPFKRKGFFLDLAASDGITHNNTHVLEKVFGWEGICVEPNPHFFKPLKKARSCVVDCSAISDKEEKVRFRIDNGQLGGIVAEDTDNNEKIRARELTRAEVINIDAITLTALLDRLNAPKVIDYFSLDVEGSEERVIRSCDFTRYQFRCITIERPTPRVNEILFEHGYLFVKNHRFDSFYVHSSLATKWHIRCQDFEQVPRKDW